MGDEHACTDVIYMQPGGYAQPPPPPRAGSNAWIGALVMVIISMALLGISMGQPWYTIEATIEGKDSDHPVEIEIEMTEEHYLDKYEIDYKITLSAPGVASETEKDSDTNDYEDADYDETAKVYEAVYNLVVITIILSIIAIIFIVLAGMKLLSVNLALIFVIISVIFSMITPLYYAFALPAAYEEDWEDMGADEASNLEYSGFMGDSSSSGEYSFILSGYIVDFDHTDYKMNWAPSVGWYLALVAMIMQFIGLAVLAGARGRMEAARRMGARPAYAPPPPRQSYMPPQGDPYAPPPRDPYSAPPPQDPYGRPPGPDPYGPPPARDPYGPPPGGGYGAPPPGGGYRGGPPPGGGPPPRYPGY